MLLRLRKLFTPPVLADNEDKRRRARFLNVIVGLNLMLVIVVLVGARPAARPPLLVWGLAIALGLTFLGLGYLVWRGRLNLARYGAVFGLVILVTAGAVVWGALQPSILAAYVLLSLIAGLLLDGWILIMALGLSVLALSGLALAERGWWLAPAGTSGGPAQWLAVIAIMIEAGLLAYMARRLTAGAGDSTRRQPAQANEARNRALLSAVPDLIFEIRRDGTYLDFVSTPDARTYLPPAEFLGRKMQDLMPAALADQAMQAVEATLDSGQVHLFEYELAMPDGPYMYEARVVASGPDTVLAIVRDITERKSAEEEIRRQAARAQALAELSQVLAAVSQDYDRVLDTAVRRCAELIGDGSSIFLLSPGSPFLELAAVYNPDPQAVEFFRQHFNAYPLRVDQGGYGRVIQSGQPLLVAEVSLDRLIAEATPEYRDYYRRLPLYSAIFAPLRAQGRVLGVLGLGRHAPDRPHYNQADLVFLQDIADRAGLALANARLYVELEQELEERRRFLAEREGLIRDLEDRNAELERFTYTVSHDLKSPLITICGFLGYLEQDARQGELDRLQIDVRRISDAAVRMQLLLDDLLELSRIGRLVNPPEAVPYEAIVREALALVEGRLAAGGVAVEVAPNLPVIYGDRIRLVEVVQNLVDNAAKFMGNQAKPCIEIGAAQAEGEDLLWVKDNGIGISPAYQERVFGLFDKLDAQSEGTGVGLALVKRIVEVHGGRIWVESTGQGQGSIFYFTLPRRPAHQAEDEPGSDGDPGR